MKLLHAADFHLDSAFSSLPPAQAARHREDQRRCLLALGDLCRREECRLLLLAGDIFDVPTPSRQSVEALKALARAVEVPVCIAPGNHDPYRAGSVYAEESWPENVWIFREESPTSVSFPTLDCRVWGAAFRQMDCPALPPFRASGPERHQIMVLHGDPAQPGSPSRPVSREVVAGSGLAYLALGHIHKGGAFRAGGTLCAWPGCAIGRGFDETGPKGALVVDLDGQADARFVPLPGGRYESLRLEVRGDGLAGIPEQLPEAAPEDFYRVTLTGRGRPDLALLERMLAPRFAQLELRDETRAPLDLDEAAQSDTLEGLYFRALRDAIAREQDPDALRRLRLAAELGRRLLDGEEVELPC